MQINRSKQEVFRFRPYMTSFAPAGTELYRQALAPEAAAEDNRLVALNVAPDYLAGLVADMLDGREVRFVEMSQPERWPRMDRLQSAFLALFEAPRRFCALTAEALANDAIMRALMRWSSVGNRIVPTRFRTDDEAVRRAVDVIQANLRAPLSLADIARAAQRDTTILVHVFKLATGRTPYAYLIESRIEAARHELRGTTLPIAEIARLYCFSSPSHFSTTFRKLTGMTPKAYREMARS